MTLGAIAAFLLVLVVIFIVGNLWFHFVESLLDRIRGLLNRRKDPPVWHPLPQEPKEQHDDPPS